MLILGIDCGSQVTGYGVIESLGRSQRAVGYGAIRTGAAKDLAARLKIVGDALDEVFERFQPAEAAVEDLFHHRNARSAFTLAHVRGVALLCAARAGRPVASYAPAQVKDSVAGHGNADKEQVRRMVSVLLGVPDDLKPLDITDALAVAYCHANRRAPAGA